MRQIKFRAWSAKYKQMNYDIGPFIDQSSGVARHLPVMQFTGLVDKNGKEIYEGDFILWRGAHYYPQSIAWSDEHGKWLRCGISRGEGQVRAGHPFKRGFDKEDADSSRVIGNIYENPEFFK